MKQLLILLMVIVFIGCAGHQVADHGVMVDENNDFVSYGNQDGSLTMFTFNGLQIKMMPMTDTRTKGVLDRNAAEFEDQIKKYEAALVTNPQDYEACIVLAGLYINRSSSGDADQAIKYSDIALSNNKNNPYALYARGLSYTEKGEAAKALSDIQAVMRMSTQSAKGVYYIMGIIYFLENNLDEAIDSFEKVTAIDSDFADTKEILEVLYLRKGK